MGRVKRIWYLSPMRAAKVQASLRIREVSPEPPLLAHTSSESRGTFRQKSRSLAPLNGWACAVKICHDGMLEDTNSLDAPHMASDMDDFKILINSGIQRPWLWTTCFWLILKVRKEFPCTGVLRLSRYKIQSLYFSQSINTCLHEEWQMQL